MTLALIYPLAALAEIGGCFAFWAWLKLDRSPLWLAPGVACLIAFAWLLTLVPSDAAGRAFAAYGGAYICASLIWMALVEKIPHCVTFKKDENGEDIWLDARRYELYR